MPLLVIVLIVIALSIIYLYAENKEYKEGTYYKLTNIPLLKLKNDIGKYGEYLTYKYLKRYEEDGARFLFNIYVPKTDETTTEIDALMISKKGLFVFESKNYSGWIFGKDNQRFWYQTLPSGRGRSHKEKFYNPVFQNNTHIKYLKRNLGDDIPMYSIITFSERCVFKSIVVNNKNIKVIHRQQVNAVVTSICNKIPNDVLTAAQIDKIYNTLYPHTQVDDNIKQKHIEDIQNKY